MKGLLALLGVVVALSLVSIAQARITITPESGGLSSLVVSPGGSFSLDLMTSGSGSIDSAVFTVEFSKAGLRYTGYMWGGSFSGSAFDGSGPGLGSLPVTVDNMTYDTPGAVERLDIYFDNFSVVNP